MDAHTYPILEYTNIPLGLAVFGLQLGLDVTVRMCDLAIVKVSVSVWYLTFIGNLDEELWVYI